MIIVDKSDKTTINIPRNSLGNMTYNKPNVDLSDYYTKEEVDELIENVEVDLTNYYTKEQVDELIASSKIPYLYVVKENGVYNYSEGSDYDGVLNAIIDNKPYFIYVPSTIGYYSIPTDISRVFGQINANVFAHTNSSIHYYIRYTLTSDNISVTEEKIEYATYDDLVNMGVYGLVVNYIEEYDEYAANGVDFYTLKQAIESGNKLYSIYLPNSDNTYKIAAQEIVVNDNEIRCITIENNGNTQTTTNWVIRFDDEYFEMHISKGDSTTISIATQEWIEEQGYLTSVPDEYITESELEEELKNIDYSLPTIKVTENETIEGDIEGVINAVINKEDCNFLWLNGNTLMKASSVYTTDSVTYIRGNFYYTSGDRAVRRMVDISKTAPYTINVSALQYASVPVDNLTSTSKVLPLSANQGRVLNEKITTISNNYVTQEWIEQQGYLTSIPSEYVTESELDIKLDEIDAKVPHIIVDYDNETCEGDLQGVIDAMKNGEEYLIYAKMDSHIYLATQNIVNTDRFSLYWFRVSSSRAQRVGMVFDYNGNFVSKTTTFASSPVDNLTSTSPGLPLSANQGRVLKGLIDTNTTNITNLTNTIGDINNALETIIG